MFADYKSTPTAPSSLHHHRLRSLLLSTLECLPVSPGPVVMKCFMAVEDRRRRRGHGGPLIAHSHYKEGTVAGSGWAHWVGLHRSILKHLTGL